MNRSLFNLVIDLLGAFGLVVMAATGFILRFPLPPATNRTHELWGLSRHEWGTIHSWASLALLAVLAVHVVLHWEWIFATIRHRFTSIKAAPNQRRDAGIVAVAVVVIVAGLFAWVTQKGVGKLEAPRHPLPAAEKAVVAVKPVDFMRDIMPIFEASCIRCHGAAKQRGGLRVDRREDFFPPGDAKPWIVPGHAEKSRLVDIVSGRVKDMKAAEDHLLPSREIVLLIGWIDGGAVWPDKQPIASPNEEP